MTELQVTAICDVHDGKLDEFMAAARSCLASVKEKDQGTLQYDWFFSADRKKCIVRERYRDSEAVMQHVGNLGDRFGALLAACDIHIEVFGDPSDELLEATASLPTTVYSYFQGM